jgi:type I restriction enzyme S subunit
MKKYDNYKDSGIEWIGQIPEHWEIDKLARVLQIDTGFTPSTGNNEFYDNGEHDWITIRDLKGKYVSESKTKLTDLAVEGKTIIPKGSLLYSFKLSVGQMAFTTKDLFTNEAIFSISPSDNLNLNYFYYLLDRILIHNSNENIYGAKILNQELIKSAKLLVPNSEEQNAIANYLDQKTTQIDQLINQKKRFIELLQEERTAVINQAVTKGLDPTVKMKDSGIEWLGEIPEHWAVKRLKYLVSEPLKYGANEPAEEEIIEDPRYIRITDFGNDGKLKKNTFKSLPMNKAANYLLSNGDILFARSGSTVGKTFLFKNYDGFACFAGYLIKATSNPDIIVYDFLYNFTNSSGYNNWKESIFQQSTIQNIGADKYNQLKIAIPPIKEQKIIIEFIAKKIGEIETIISKSQQEIVLLKEYKIALISEVVTGKVDVRDVVLN